MIISSAVPAGAVPVSGAGSQTSVVDEIDDPNPLPPVEDELVDDVVVVPADELPPVVPVEELVDAEPVDPPVLPEAEVVDLAVDGEAPPAEEVPVDPPGEERLSEVGFPLAVYVPEELPEDPPGGGERLSDDVIVPSSVLAQVLDPSVVESLGGVGLGFRLSRSDSVPTAGVVATDAVYDGFRYAAGGDFALRLQLVSLPACVLDTPTVPACQVRTVVETTNLFEEGILRGVLDVVPAAATDGAVFVVESKASGPAGDFAATPVTPNGRWDVGLGSGGFSWSEQLPSVPVRNTNGTASGPSLSYSSQSVDGRVSVSNNQATWAGMGWDLSSGFITRQYESCVDDGHPSWGDFCWHSENASITLNGVTSEMVQLPGGLEWRLRDDPGWRVSEVDDPHGGGQVWRVVTPDGTQYLFGAADPVDAEDADVQLDTESKLGVRVYGAPYWAGDGCGTTLLCSAPWKWNLSHVIDTSENTTVFSYVKENNKYYSGVAEASQSYNRHGYLKEINFGLRGDDVDTLNRTNATSRITYTTQLRCKALSACPAAETAAWDKYPDVPLDLLCTGSEKCKDSPTFFSTVALASVKAFVKKNDGVWVMTDRTEMTMKFPAAGTKLDPHLWLEELQTIGSANGTDLALPIVKFGGVNLANRLDTSPGIPNPYMHRLDSIQTSTGGVVKVAYGRPDPCTLASDLHPATNTLNCFPVRLPTDHDDPDGFGWFHNYVVTSVLSRGVGIVEADWMTTSYTYTGGGAWHYDDNITAAPEDREWTEWRGYGQVTVSTGEGAGATKDVYRIHRGMHYDYTDIPSDGSRKSVTVTDANGVARVDRNWLRGQTFQHQRFDGATEVERNTYGTGYVRASSSIEEQLGAARMVVQPWSEQRHYPGSTGTKTYRTNTTFDPTHGQVLTVSELGDTAVADDNRCTAIQYAVALPADGPTRWLVAPERTTLYDGACSGGTLVAKTDITYDGHILGQVPGRGLPTRVAQFASTSDWSSTTTSYDSCGRVTSVTDPRSHTTTTEYVTAGTGGTHDAIVVTNEAGHVTTTELGEVRRVPFKVIDANGNRTQAALDSLGRTLSVWKPGRSTSDDPSLKYSYHLSRTEPTRVTTQTLLRDSDPAAGVGEVYVHSHQYYDGLGRARQTQMVAPGGNPDRVVTDTRFDNRGYAVAQTAPLPMGGTAGTGMVVPELGSIPSETRTTYDGLGRATKTALWASGSAVADHNTVYTYAAASSTTDPAAGMAVTTSYDAYGQPVKIVEDADSTGDSDWETDYDYNARGDLTAIEDSAGRDTTYTYDWLSRRTASDDPDAGHWSTTYNDIGMPTVVTDAEGDSTHTVYDELDRKTKLYAGTSDSGTLLAEWTYDEGTDNLGRLTGSISWDGGAATGVPYETKNLTYDVRGQLTGKTIDIDADAPGATQGNYTYSYAYDEAGHRTSTTYPAFGTLESETVTQAYSTRGYETNLVGHRPVAGDTTYVASTTYTPYGTVSGRSYGGTNNVTRAYAYNASTRRLASMSTTTGASPVVTLQDTAYTYTAVGNVSGIHTAGPSTLNECFRYDVAGRLAIAVTRTGAGCSGDRAAETDPGAYDIRYTYTSTGNVTRRTNGYSPAGRFHDYTNVAHAVTKITEAQYDADGDDGPHFPPPPDRIGEQPTNLDPADVPATTLVPGTSQPVENDQPAGETGVAIGDLIWESTVDTFTYDDNGQMLTHMSNPYGAEPETTQTYGWTERHKLATTTSGTGESALTSTNIYDADNNRIIRDDDGTITLYLEGMEIKTDSTGANPTATRYYTSGSGVAVGLRAEGSSWVRVLLNHQGSTQYLITNGSNTVNLIEYDPWGATRNTAPSTPASLPTDSRFLAAPHDDTIDLIYLNARMYDAGLGAFLSPDSLMDLGNPQSLNGYRYSLNNPATYTDATGMAADDGCGGCTIPRPPQSPQTPGAIEGCGQSCGSATAVVPVYTPNFTGTFPNQSDWTAAWWAGSAEFVASGDRDWQAGPLESFKDRLQYALEVCGGNPGLCSDSYVRHLASANITGGYGGDMAMSDAGAMFGGIAMGGLGAGGAVSKGSKATPGTSGGGLASAEDVLGGLSKGRSSGVRTVGSDEELDAVFEALTRGGSPLAVPGYKGTWIERTDGVRVGMRSTSISGGRAIDIRYPDGTTRKVHLQ